MKSKSFVFGQWLEGQTDGVKAYNAVTGALINQVSSAGIDMQQVLDYAKHTGGPNLRKLTIHQRAEALKALGLHLLELKNELEQVILNIVNNDRGRYCGNS